MTPSQRRRPCPCIKCKPHNETQLPGTIRLHLKKHLLALPLRWTPAGLSATPITVLENAVNPDPDSSSLASESGSAHTSLSRQGSPITVHSVRDADSIEFAREYTPLLFPSDSEPDGRSLTGLSLSRFSETQYLWVNLIHGSDSCGSPDPSDDEEEVIIEDDPLFRSRETIFQDIPDSDSEDEDDTPLPQALSKHPALRNAYVHVFVDSAYRGATHKSTKSSLTSTLSTIKTMLAGKDAPLDLNPSYCIEATWS